MAHKYTRPDGTVKVLLNPAEKGQLYAKEIKDNYNPRTGNGLTKSEFRYRAGYLDARRDSARAWKHNQEKKKAAAAAKRSSKRAAKI